MTDRVYKKRDVVDVLPAVRGGKDKTENRRGKVREMGEERENDEEERGERGLS